MPSTKIVTLAANTNTVVTLDGNYGAVEVALISGAATTLFNAAGVVVPGSTPVDGHHVLTAVLPAKIVADETSGTATVVNLRSAGTPTVSVSGL